MSSRPLIVASLLAGLLAAPGPLAAGVIRNTTFDPGTHGFAFSNSFKNDIVLDITTGGLCGGMVYTALDHFEAKKAMPRWIDYRPATGSALERYIFQRQVDSITGNLDKWAELGVNPFGARNSEFFRWGLQGTGGGRLQELRAKLDQGKPVPLGLWHADGHPQRPGDHQVLAIGYEMGRYKGDLGAYKEDLKIHIYDPNYPGSKMTLVPDPASGTYYYSNVSLADREKTRWLTYFVDGKYRMKAPVNVPRTDLGGNDGRVRELVLEFATGGDDLRGGRDNAGVTLQFVGKPPQQVPNINRGTRWIGGYSQRVPIPLREPVRPEEIGSVTITTSFGGGIGGDNWNLDKLVVRARGGGVDRILFEAAGRPLQRFTGSVHTFTARPRWLLLDAGAGRRGLPAGGGGLTAIVVYRGRPPQTMKNIGGGGAWAANTAHAVPILLNQSVPVVNVSLISKATWDMNSLKLRIRDGGSDKVHFEKAAAPLHAFAPTKSGFVAPLGPGVAPRPPAAAASRVLLRSPAMRRTLLTKPVKRSR